MSGQPVETPEFVRWAIARACPLRDSERWQDPEIAERHLRPLRAFSEALAEQRIFEGVCIEPGQATGAIDPDAKGFRASEILDHYGGQPFVESCCGGCPANATAKRVASALVGCHGWFETSLLRKCFLDSPDDAWESMETFPRTWPRWYGWFSISPLDSRQCGQLAKILSRSISAPLTANSGIAIFVTALQIAQDEQVAIHLELIPRGHADSLHWTVVAHCPRCKAEQPENTRHCAVCGRSGGPIPPRKRKVRGDRPYWPLARFMGTDNVGPFLRRYREFRRSQPD